MATKITPIDGAALLRLIQSGQTLKQIAADHAVSTITVYRWTRLYDIKTASNKGRKRTDPFTNGVRRSKRKPVKPAVLPKTVVRSAPSAGALAFANPFGL